MPRTNPHLDSIDLAPFYRRDRLDIMLFTYIDLYKSLYPSVTIKEAAQAFMRKHKMSEEFYSLSTAITTYERTLKDYLHINGKKNQ